MAGDFRETWKLYMDVSENSGTPKSSLLLGFSIINHPFWGTPILGNPHIHLEPVVSWCKKPRDFFPIFGNSMYFEKCWRSSRPTKGWSENNSLPECPLPIGSMYGIFSYSYIWLFLMVKYGKCRQIYHTWILWVMKIYNSNPSETLGWNWSVTLRVCCCHHFKKWYLPFGWW